jgi:uncharacterized membrane protein YgdD (TMEM256/DUF423 family)
MGRLWLMLGCLFCCLTVVVGAFGAHMLKDVLTPELLPIFDTATRYMMFHGVALLALGLWSHWERWAASFWPGLFFVFGIILFSGSLYGIVFTGQRWLGMITPAGGTLFILGWLLFMFSVFRTRNKFV